MAEKPDKQKKKPAKPKKTEKSVLGALPTTRPDPIGRGRAGTARTREVANAAARAPATGAPATGAGTAVSYTHLTLPTICSV